MNQIDYVFLSQLGKTLDVERSLSLIEKNQDLSYAEIQSLRSEPQILCLKRN